MDANDIIEQMRHDNEQYGRLLEWRMQQHREQMKHKYGTSPLLDAFCEELGRIEEAVQDFSRKHGKRK